MKVALVHDYIKEYGGAERVLEKLVELFPDATVYTLVYCPEFLGPHREKFKNIKVKTSILQHIPFKHKFISLFRIVSPQLFRQFDFSQFDVIIVSQTGAYFPNLVRKTNDQRLICYTHTPPRYLYGYKTAREWKNNILFLILGELANHFLRMVDFEASKKVDYFIANSNEVASRIKKFYRRDSIVIYPPAVKISDDRRWRVESRNLKMEARRSIYPKSSNLKNLLPTTYHLPSNKEYYLTGGRLARAKGIDIVIDAFIKLGRPLKIFGRGFAGYDSNIKDQISNIKNIEYLGEVSDEKKFELMKNAKAFVFASFDEDFGITPVETMSVGTPVIAYNSGGVKETVIDPSSLRSFRMKSSQDESSGQVATGVLYDVNDAKHLIDAILKFEKLHIKPEDCIQRAQKFSEERFKKEILSFVQQSK